MRVYGATVHSVAPLLSVSTVISAALLVSATARVAHAAGPDSVRTSRAAKADDDSLRGRSGKLRAVLVPRSERRAGVLERLFGDSLLRTPGRPRRPGQRIGDRASP